MRCHPERVPHTFAFFANVWVRAPSGILARAVIISLRMRHLFRLNQRIEFLTRKISQFQCRLTQA